MASPIDVDIHSGFGGDPLTPPKDLVGKVALRRISGPVSSGFLFEGSTNPIGKTIIISSFYSYIGCGEEKTRVDLKSSLQHAPTMLEVEDCVADISWGFRGLWDLIQNVDPALQGSAPAGEVMTITAETSVLSGVAAFFSWMSARQQLEESKKSMLQDAYKQEKAQAQIAASGAKLTANLTMTAYRQLSLACFVSGVDHTKKADTLLGKAAFYTGFAGFSFVTTFLALYTTFGAVSFRELLQFALRCPLEDYSKFAQFLKQELNITPKTTFAKIEKLAEEKKIEPHDFLALEGQRIVNEYMEKLQDISSSTKNKKELGAVEIQAFLEQGPEGLLAMQNKLTEWLSEEDGNFFTENNFSSLELLGLYIATAQQKQQKKEELERCLGAELVEKLLGGNLLRSIQEEKELLADVQNSLIKQGVWQVFLLSVLSLATVTLGLITVSLFLTAPAIILAASICNAIIGFVTILVDMSSFGKKYLTEGAVSLREKIMGSSNLLIGIGCFIAIAVLSAASLGTAPVAIAVTIAGFWVILSIADLIALYFKEKRYHESHLSQEELLACFIKLKTQIAKSNDKKLEKMKTKVQNSFKKTLENSYLTKETKENILEKLSIEVIDTKEIEEIKDILSMWKGNEKYILQALDDAKEFFPEKEDARGSPEESVHSYFKHAINWISGLATTA